MKSIAGFETDSGQGSSSRPPLNAWFLSLRSHHLLHIPALHTLTKDVLLEDKHSVFLL